MANPVEIYLGDVDGQGWTKTTGWTSMSLERSKETLTGNLSIDFFYGYVPEKPVQVDAAYGREVLVYIDGWLAFTGIIDGRNGEGSNSDMGGEGRSISIGPNEYSVQITARGKTKQLIDSSHDILTNMNGSNTQEATEKLIAPWAIALDWLADPQTLDKLRFREGARVVDELKRIARENAHYMWEGRDGSLIVRDQSTSDEIGPDLILGQNILTFSATQSESLAKSSIRVRGQRTENTAWGEDAVLPPVIEVVGDDLLANTLRPICVQHYGNATPEALERRALYEANDRTQNSKRVSIDVFGVSTSTGRPWDIGLRHRVVIPPEGIDTALECTGLRFTCTPNDLKTTLTLAPIPVAAKAGQQSGALDNLPEEEIDRISSGAAIRYLGQYPAPWSVGQWVVNKVPLVSTLLDQISSAVNRILGGLRSIESVDGKPPERID